MQGTHADTTEPLPESVAADSAKPVGLSGVRILLVEDDDDSRTVLEVLLKRQRAEVIAVSSTAAALAVLAESLPSNGPAQHSALSTQHSAPDTLPDIIISDLGMPEEDGYQLMREIRSLATDSSPNAQPSSLKAAAAIPAIALTGYATTKDRERALAAGYQLHIPKPVEPEELVVAILSVLSGRQHEAVNRKS